MDATAGSNSSITAEEESHSSQPSSEKLAEQDDNKLYDYDVEQPPSVAPKSSDEKVDEEDDELLDASQQCAICIERFTAGEEMCCSHDKDCVHKFHRSCITAWLLKHEDCPCCRRNYLDFESDDDEMISNDGGS